MPRDKNLSPVLMDSLTRRENIRQKTLDGLTESFPLKTKNHLVTITNPHVETREYSSREQKDAILKGTTLSERVKGDIVVKDAQGKIVNEAKDFTLMRLPYFTPRHTFIVDGTEYNVANQIRTKPGVYTRRRGNDELEATFNLAKGSNFRVLMDPEKGHLFAQPTSSASRIPLYPVLRSLGVPHQDIAKQWGSTVAETNRAAFKKPEKHVDKFYQSFIHPALQTHATPEDRVQAVHDYLDKTEMSSEVTKRTLGESHDKASPLAILAASKKLLDVHRNEAKTDDRDSLEFKTLHSVDDFIKERIRLDARGMKAKLGLKLDAHKGNVRKALPPAPFTRSVHSFLAKSALSAVPMQINPMELMDSAVRITALGEGAISSDRAIPLEARNIHSTHFGVIDPIRTPESFKTGIDLRSAMTTRRDKQGNLYSMLRNVKTGRRVPVKASELAQAVVAFPGESIQKGRMVDVMKGGQVDRVASQHVTHQIDHASDLYGPTTNLLPLIDGMQGNRALMGSKQQTQALSLVHREAPLVQVRSWNPRRSIEQEMVSKIVPTAPVAGTIEKIDPDYIYLRPTRTKRGSADDDGFFKRGSYEEDDEFYSDFLKLANEDGLLRLHYDTNFPLAAKSYLHNDLKVKAGDKVSAGQNLAHSNFTKDDTLALGTNLRVAYMPYRGLNTNDGLVVSEGAAKRLVSEHMYKYVMQLDSDLTAKRDKHRAYFGSRYSAQQYGQLDDDGVIKKGAEVQPQDPLIVAVRANQATGNAVLLGRLSKSLVKPYIEEVETWDHDRPGTVIDVVKTARRITVTVKTEEVLGIGDKLCFDEATEVLTDIGWKPIADISIDDRICTLNNKEIHYETPTATHRYETGGRMYYIKTQQIDQVTTENHQAYVQQRGNRDFVLTPVNMLYNKRVRYKKNGDWRGAEPTHYTFPPLNVKAGQYGNGKRNIPALRMPVKTYLMLLGAYLSEGNIVDHPASGNYGIDLCQKKEPNRTVLIDALKQAQINHCFTGDKVRIYSKQLMVYFRQFGLAADKFIPDEVLTWSPRLLSILFTWLMWGDGHTEKLPICYHTTSKRLADDFQRLCLHVGKAANIDVKTEAGPQVIKGHTYDCQTCYRIGIINKKLTPQVNHGHTKEQHTQEEGFLENYAHPVFCVTVPNHILYVRRNGKPCWSGNSGRYGNKGVIAKIIPDNKMIQDEKGRPVDLLFTSAGVVTRINPGQIIEAALGKVAEKTGKPIVLDQFAPHDNVKHAKKLLKKHNLTDKEIVYDPETQRKIPGVFVGKSYIHKLFKTTDSNWSAHGAERYDFNQQPARGGDEGAKGLGKMEFDGLVAHNARNVLREAASIKGQRNDEFWRAVQLGLPTPAPQTSFAYNKFLSALNGAGVKVDKRANQLALGPLTDNDIKKMSSGTLRSPQKLLRAKDLRPETGGIFDPAVTGGTNGTKWSHVNLHEPIVNPVFAEPVRRLLGLTQKQFSNLHGQHGGTYFKKELRKINIDNKLEDLHTSTRQQNGAKLDDTVKQIKYLTALKEQNLKPQDAYVLSKIPVTPPVIRPVLPLKDGRLQVGDANLLYRDAFLANKQLGDVKKVLPADELKQPRNHLYEAVGAVFGTHAPVSPTSKKRGAKGYLNLIAGTRPGSGFFQSKLMKRQQDISGRATIAPDPTLSMDEVGVPEQMLWGMYGKFVIGRLVHRGYSATDAKQMVDDRHPTARSELMAESRERPVMVNRAPSLHRFNIIGAFPKVVEGKTVRLNPFAEHGMNADYDGDAIQIHAPVTAAGVDDVKRMTLSNLIFSDRKRDTLNVAPEMESVLGLHRATMKGKGGKVKHFATKADALSAYHHGEITLQDNVEIGR